jgi:hypothetical protein
MDSGKVLDREEYIEQAYFFRVLRERLATTLVTQDVLSQIHQEILSTTRLPYAVQFLATELKHSGLLSSGFERLLHYFTPYQAFVMRQTEIGGQRLATDTALLVLEREAAYRAAEPTCPGLFIYQFEALSRNRLGYDEGLAAMAKDPLYDTDWRSYLDIIRRQIGVVDFADLIYLRSDQYVFDERRKDSDYQPPVRPLFGEKEGKIAWANRGHDPLFLFAALQRQLGYPEVPRPRPRDDLESKFGVLQAKFREMESRFKLVESEVRGQADMIQLLGKPELLSGPPGDDD